MKQMLTPQHSKGEHRTEYRRQKFPGITVDEVQQAIAKFQRVTGRFSTLQVLPIEKDMVRIVRQEC